MARHDERAQLLEHASLRRRFGSLSASPPSPPPPGLVTVALLLASPSAAPPPFAPTAAASAVSEAAAGPLSRLTFSWMTPLFELGNIRPLETADLPEPSPADDATACTEKLERMWEKRAKRVAKLRAKPPKKRSPGLQFGLSWRFLGWRFVLAGVLLLFLGVFK